MKRLTIVLPFVVIGAACQSRTPDNVVRTPTIGPATAGQPAGSPSATPVLDATAPPRSTSHLQKIRIETAETTFEIANGVQYKGWTFGGRAPGPFFRATVGDTIDFTLVNLATIPHNMDFHAAEVAPSKLFANVVPHDSIHYRFVPRVPGAFLYHCVASPGAAHVGNGMYGAFIVDPVQPRAPAKEFVLVQSEFYLTPDSSGKPRSMSYDKLVAGQPDYVVFNGRSGQYLDHPLLVKTNELVRLYVLDAGPDRMSSFHVVGAIFDKIYVDGSDHPLVGVQTWPVVVGSGSIFELRLKQAGDYPFATHTFADGAIGTLRAEDGK